MRPFRILFFPLIFSLCCHTCAPTPVLSEGEPAGGIPPEKFSLPCPGDGSLLFKARITLYRHEYSGLFLIKRMPADSSVHIVFLSEIGLSLLDLKYRHDDFEVASVQEFMHRPSSVKTLQNDFRSLLLDLQAIGDYSIETGADSTEILRFRHKSQKYAYYSREGPGLYRIRQRTGWFKLVDVSIVKKEKLNIGISHRGVKLAIELQQLEKLKDHVD
jgi:hypothetical protein